MPIILTDDGTLDTVLLCTECDEEFRYKYAADDGPDDLERAERLDSLAGIHPGLTNTQIDKLLTKILYNEWLDWAIEDAESEHVCGAGEEGDFRRFKHECGTGEKDV